MTLGAMTERIVLLRPVETADGMGGAVLTFVAFGEAWADVQPVRASETERQGAVRELQVYLFRIHRRPDLNASHVVEWAGRRFNIREVRLPPQRDLFMTLVAETGVTP